MFCDAGSLPVWSGKPHHLSLSGKRWGLIQQMRTGLFGCTWEAQGLFGSCSYCGLTPNLHLKSLPENPVQRGWRVIRCAPGSKETSGPRHTVWPPQAEGHLPVGFPAEDTDPQGWKELLRASSPSPEMALESSPLRTDHTALVAVFGKLPRE